MWYGKFIKSFKSSSSSSNKQQLYLKLISIFLLMLLFYFMLLAMLLVNICPPVDVKLVWIILPSPEESSTTSDVLRRTARNHLLWNPGRGHIYKVSFYGWWCLNLVVVISWVKWPAQNMLVPCVCKFLPKQHTVSPPFPTHDMLPPLSCHIPMTINLIGFHVYLLSYNRWRLSCKWKVIAFI